ncbi:hypothetical protein EP7_004374 [Isosphaeraceae bacterium EP7]
MPIEGRVHLTHEDVRHASKLKPSRDDVQLRLVFDGENDGVRVWWNFAGDGLSGSVDDLGRHEAERKIGPDDDVVSQGNVSRNDSWPERISSWREAQAGFSRA